MSENPETVVDEPVDEEPPQRPLMRQDSRLVMLLFGMLLGLLGLSHWHSQIAFPEMGVYTSTGIGVAMLLTLLAAGAVGRLRALLCWPVALFMALLIWSTLSFAWSVSIGDGLQVMGTWLEGYWVFCAVIVGWRLASKWQIEEESEGADESLDEEVTPVFSAPPRRVAATMLFGFLAVVAVVGAGHATYQYLFGYDRALSRYESLSIVVDQRIHDGLVHAFREKRVAASYGNSNVFCYILAMALPFIVGFASSRRRAWSIALWGLAAVLVLGAAYLSKSRGGWLCVALSLVASGVIIGAARWRTMARPLIFAVVLGAVGWGILLVGDVSTGSSSKTKTPPAAEQVEAGLWKRLTRVSTIRERVYYMEAVVRQIRWNAYSPLLGNGLGSFATLYPQTKSEGARESRFAHNTPLQVLGEGGIPALALLTAILALALWAGLGGGRWRRWDEETGLPLTGMGTAAALVFIASSLIDYAFYYREFFLDGCLAMGWLVALHQEEAPEKTEKPRRTMGYVALTAWIVANGAGGWYFLAQPTRAAALSLAGDEFAGAGETEEALQLFRKASEIQGNHYRYLSAQAAMYERLDLLEDAFTARDRAMRLNPYSAQLCRAQAMLLLRMNEAGDALSMAERAIRLYPLHPDGYAAHGFVLRELGRKDEANAAFRKAAELERDAPEKYLSQIEP